MQHGLHGRILTTRKNKVLVKMMLLVQLR